MVAILLHGLVRHINVIGSMRFDCHLCFVQNVKGLKFGVVFIALVIVLTCENFAFCWSHRVEKYKRNNMMQFE